MLALWTLLACHRGEPVAAPPVSPPVLPAEDSFAADMRRVCESYESIGADKLPPEEQTPALMAYFEATLVTEEAKRLMRAVAQMRPADKVTVMEEELARAGIAECALLERMRPTP